MDVTVTETGGRFVVDDGETAIDACPCCDVPFDRQQAEQFVRNVSKIGHPLAVVIPVFRELWRRPPGDAA